MQHRKVYLKGESPWAIIVKELGDDRFLGQIDNHLVNTEEHKHKFGDLVVFHLVDYGSFRSWEPDYDYMRSVINMSEASLEN